MQHSLELTQVDDAPHTTSHTHDCHLDRRRFYPKNFRSRESKLRANSRPQGLSTTMNIHELRGRDLMGPPQTLLPVTTCSILNFMVPPKTRIVRNHGNSAASEETKKSTCVHHAHLDAHPFLTLPDVTPPTRRTKLLRTCEN